METNFLDNASDAKCWIMDHGCSEQPVLVAIMVKSIALVILLA